MNTKMKLNFERNFQDYRGRQKSVIKMASSSYFIFLADFIVSREDKNMPEK